MIDSGMELLLLDTQYRMHPAIAEFPRWGDVGEGWGWTCICGVGGSQGVWVHFHVSRVAVGCRAPCPTRILTHV